MLIDLQGTGVLQVFATQPLIYYAFSVHMWGSSDPASHQKHERMKAPGRFGIAAETASGPPFVHTRHHTLSDRGEKPRCVSSQEACFHGDLILLGLPFFWQPGCSVVQSLQALPVCRAAGASVASWAAKKPWKLTQKPDNNAYSNYLVIICHNFFLKFKDKNVQDHQSPYLLDSKQQNTRNHFNIQQEGSFEVNHDAFVMRHSKAVKALSGRRFYDEGKVHRKTQSPERMYRLTLIWGWRCELYAPRGWPHTIPQKSKAQRISMRPLYRPPRGQIGSHMFILFEEGHSPHKVIQMG